MLAYLTMQAIYQTKKLTSYPLSFFTLIMLWFTGYLLLNTPVFQSHGYQISIATAGISTSIGYLLLKGITTGEIRRVLAAFMIIAAFLSITVGTATYLSSIESHNKFTQGNFHITQQVNGNSSFLK